MDTHTKFIRASSRRARRAHPRRWVAWRVGQFWHTKACVLYCLIPIAAVPRVLRSRSRHTHIRVPRLALLRGHHAHVDGMSRVRVGFVDGTSVARLAALACALPRRGGRFARGRSELMTTTNRRRCRRPTCSGAARRVVHRCTARRDGATARACSRSSRRRTPPTSTRPTETAARL